MKEYTQQGQAAGRLGSNAPSISKPRFIQLLDNTLNMLNLAHEAADRLRAGVDRLSLSDVPPTTSSGVACEKQPTPVTVEARLEDINSSLDNLIGRLNSANQRLNTLV